MTILTSFKIKHTLLVIFLLFFSPFTNFAQQFFRIKADFSIKEKAADGKERLTMGQVYYDKTAKKVVYSVKFPEKETWVVIDTLLYRIVNKQVKEVHTIPAIAEFSIFHLALNGGIADYGLKKSFYTIKKVEKENDMVLTTWNAPEKFSKMFGKIIMSQKNKRLFGVVFFSAKDSLLSKQFFKSYTNVNGLDFPSEIVQIAYIRNTENYQITTYKNIIVDDLKEDNMYNYRLLK